MWLRAVRDGIQGGGPFAKTSGVCAPGAKDRVALAQCMHDHAIVFEMAHGAESVYVSGLKMNSTLGESLWVLRELVEAVGDGGGA